MNPLPPPSDLRLSSPNLAAEDGDLDVETETTPEGSIASIDGLPPVPGSTGHGEPALPLSDPAPDGSPLGADLVAAGETASAMKQLESVDSEDD